MIHGKKKGVMRLFYEWGIRELRKHHEELGGDSVAVSRHSDSVTLAFLDGLGSGVKANILATLTTRIAMHLLENNLPLDDVVQTIGQTLSVDNEREIACCKFAIAQFFSKGKARVVEFDTPGVIWLRKQKIQKIEYSKRSIEEKIIKEAVIELNNGDLLVFVSDGVLNAGINGIYPLGWGWDFVARFIEKNADPELSAEELAGKIADVVDQLYADSPGDDVSIIVIKARSRKNAVVFTGPPLNGEMDNRVVRDFFKQPGTHIVCGGTTAKIVSRYLVKPLEVDLSTMTPDIPPIGHMDGIELVSEGILTLTKTGMLLRSAAEKNIDSGKADGASSLLNLLLNADHIHFIVGQALNPDQQNPNLPDQPGIRVTIVRDIASLLRSRGKEVTTEFV